MTEIKLLRIHAENFMSYKDMTMEFSDRSVISGRNKSGKTTVKHLLNWVLLNCTADGKEPKNIRPFDKDGKNIDYVDIVGEVTLLIDGREVTVKKVQKQKWRTERSTGIERFDGNINIIYVDGAERTEKNFKAWFEKIIGFDIFEYCSNSSRFFKLSTKDRREKLFSMIPSYDDADIVEMFPEFDGVNYELKLGTPERISVDDAIKALKKQINGSGGRDKGLNGQLDDMQTRIDEASKGLPNLDELKAAQEKLKKSGLELEELLEQEREKLSILEKDTTLIELEFKKSDYEREANKNLVKDKADLENSLLSLKNERRIAEINCTNASEQVSRLTLEKERLSNKVEDLKAQFKRAKATVFDESQLNAARNETFDEHKLVCPTCGREYDKSKQEELRTRFEKNKQARIDKLLKGKEEFESNLSDTLKKLAEEGKKQAASRDEMDAKIADASKAVETFRAVIKGYDESISDVSKSIEMLPDCVDISEHEEYKAILAEIKSCKEKSDESESICKETINRLTSEIAEIREEFIGTVSAVKNASERLQRVDQLKDERACMADALAECKQRLDLLNKFNKKKLESVSDKINSHFRKIRFELFNWFQNGDYTLVCNVTYDGANYNAGLNEGHRRFAEVDLLTTFQRINDVNVPIFIDNSEGIDSITAKEIEEVIKPECQMIQAKVTENELKVEDRLND